MVIDGKTYFCIRPYHGEIAGYTYMETICGPDDTAVGGYIYWLRYVPNDEVKQYNFNNKLTVGYNIFSKAYNLSYFNVYMPYMQAQYGQNISSGAVLDDAMGSGQLPKPGDPNFIGPLLPKPGDPNFIEPLLPKPDDPNFIGPLVNNGSGGAIEGPGKINVTEKLIRETMKDAKYQSLQDYGVDMNKVQEYVDKMLAGEEFPPIKVDLSTNNIVDGNHRYIASQIAGVEVDVRAATQSMSKTPISWDDIAISEGWEWN